MREKISSQKKITQFFAKNFFWLILFSALFVIFFLAPPTGDDFTFMNYQRNFPGFGGFLESSSWMFQNLNGRILGNGTMLLLANFQVLGSLFQALVVVSIIYSITRIIALVQQKPAQNFAPLVALFLLAAPLALYRQTYGWSAGFYNYVLPVALLLLAALFLTQLFFEKNPTKFRRSKIFLIAFFAFLASLCAENITLGLVLIAAILLIISFFTKNKTFRVATFSLFFGALVGAILMFSSPIYQKIAAGKDAYRSFDTKQNVRDSKCQKIFNERFAKYCAKFASNVNDFSNLLLNEKYYLFYASAIFAVIFLFQKKYFGLKHRRLKFLRRPIFAKILLAILILILVFLTFRGALLGGANSAKITTLIKIANFAATLGFYGLLALIFLVYNRNRAVAFLSSFLIFASVVFVAPLLLVSPFGSRNFYISFALANFAILLILAQIFSTKLLALARRISAIALSGLFLLFVFANGANFVVYATNDAAAKTAVKNGEKVVEFREYIFKDLKYFNNNSGFSRRVTKMYYNKQKCIYAIARTCRGGNDLEIKFQK